MNIAIIGRTKILYDTALALHRAGHKVSAVITAPAAPEYDCREDNFKALAQEFKTPFFLVNSLEETAVVSACRGLDLGVSVNWTSLISKKCLELFRLGILNVHLGDLPAYRGNAPAAWAILRNEKIVTLSVHFMEGGELDCGKVVRQEIFPLAENTRIGEIYKWLEDAVPQLMVKSVKLIMENPQTMVKYADPNAENAFRCYPRMPEDGFIDWHNPIEKVHNLIRCSGFPFAGAYTFQMLDNQVKKLIVLESRIVEKVSKDAAEPGHVLKNDPVSGESFVRCDKGVIALLKCRYEDEAEIFEPGRRWKSIRIRLGVRPEDWLWHLTKKLK